MEKKEGRGRHYRGGVNGVENERERDAEVNDNTLICLRHKVVLIRGVEILQLLVTIIL